VVKNENPPTLSLAKDYTTVTEDNIAFEKAPSEKTENNTAKLPSPSTK